MDLQAWKRRRLIPTWGGNDAEPEPCAILYHPPSVGWMARWREVAMAAPTLDPQKFAERTGEDGFAGKVSAWGDLVQTFREEMITALVVGVENLTLEGRSVDLSEALAFVMDNEGLREEVFAALLAEGTLTDAEGKG